VGCGERGTVTEAMVVEGWLSGATLEK
jgi:hypothetical protein